MIRVTVAGHEHDLDHVQIGTLVQQIARRRNDGEAVCVQVHINFPGIKAAFSTPECPRIKHRPAKPSEQPLLDAWRKHGLDEANFPPGALAAFLNEVKRTVPC